MSIDMCKDCEKPSSDSKQKGKFALSRTKPTPIWNMDSSWMCSLIGTCLTIEELKKLQHRNKVSFSGSKISDYKLHSFFVKTAMTDKKIGRSIQSMLERKYRLLWKKFILIDSVEELEREWENALKEGDIAGPYWVILAHPLVTQKLANNAFGEVHMLSHLVGATNRADLKTMRKNEIEIDKLRDELERTRYEAWSRGTIIDRLRKELGAEKRLNLEASKKTKPLAGKSFESLKATSNRLRDALLMAENDKDMLKSKLERRAKRIEVLEIEREHLIQQMTQLETESQVLESVVPTLAGEKCENDGGICPGEDACPYDLCQKSVLYVGGRATLVSRYRGVIESWNGKFLHHDGGLEQSFEHLGGLLEKADVVVFPVDCVSHAAVEHIKRRSRQYNKRMMAVRTAGLGSLMSGLQNMAQQSRQPNKRPNLN